MLAYLRRVIATGTEESSRRFALVAAALTFSVAILSLTAGAMVALAQGLGTAGLAEALWPLCLSFGALAGVAYTRGPAPDEGGGGATPPAAPINAPDAKTDGVAPAFLGRSGDGHL